MSRQFEAVVVRAKCEGETVIHTLTFETAPDIGDRVAIESIGLSYRIKWVIDDPLIKSLPRIFLDENTEKV